MSHTAANSDVAARLGAVREQIRKRLAETAPPLPETVPAPVERLQDAAATARSLAPAIGTVNPRPAGLVNSAIQGVKEAAARLLDWQVRPQREFNRATVECFTKTAELLEATNRNLAVLAAAFEPFARGNQELAGELDRIVERESQQTDQLSQELEEKLKRQRWALEGMLQRQEQSLRREQRNLTEGLRQELLEELRILRQRVAAQAQAGPVISPSGPVPAGEVEAPAPASPGFDYLQFEQRFRGSEEEIRARQSFYSPFFRERKNVLDLACGRGEFLELMREWKVPARGVDLDADMVGRCRGKSLDVVRADVFSYLAGVPDGSLDGIFSAQFVEHLPLEAYAGLIAQCARKLAPGGVLAIETPNPECLATFSQSFYLDPTHVRPIPPGQLHFLFAEAGLVRITVHFLSPAGGHLPLIPPLVSRVIEPDRLQAWNDAVARFNETFFGGMDYAVIGYRSGNR
jgi:O-antigen chain-terminating methyltransferase